MLQQKFWHFLHGRIGPPKSYERYFYHFPDWVQAFSLVKMLRNRCLKTVIFVLESPWKVLDFAQQKSVWTLYLWRVLTIELFITIIPQLFQRCLVKVLAIDLWKLYLNYIKDTKGTLPSYRYVQLYIETKQFKSPPSLTYMSVLYKTILPINKQPYFDNWIYNGNACLLSFSGIV
jgi:hypothetical protein